MMITRKKQKSVYTGSNLNDVKGYLAGAVGDSTEKVQEEEGPELEIDGLLQAVFCAST